MKVREALDILNALSPDHEVTLTINGVGLKWPEKDPNPYYRDWVIGKEQWVPRDPNVYPYKHDITCKGNLTLH